MKYTIVLLISLFPFFGFSQDNPNHGTIKVRKDIPVEDYIDIDFVPEYTFGILNELLQKNIKYPEDAKRRKIEGTVDVLVIIDQSGEMVWKEVVQGVYPSIDKEAMRILTGLQNFVPIQKDGAFVNVRTTISIPFKI